MSVTIVPGTKLTELPLTTQVDLNSLLYTVDISDDTSYSVSVSTVANGVVEYLGNYFLPLTGGTMTGHISSALTPSVGVHIVNKTYVDTLIAATSGYEYLYNNYLPLSGGTITGHISTGALDYAANSTELVNKGYVDTTFLKLAGGTMTGKITLDGNPTASLHAATKAYVDSLSTISNSAVSRIITNNTGDCRDNMGRWCSIIVDGSNTLRTSGLYGNSYNGGMGYFATVYDNFRPLCIEYLSTLEAPLSVLQNGYSTWVLTTSGNVYAAGKNSAGQLGVGDDDRRNVFTVSNVLSNGGVTVLTINSSDFNESTGNTNTTVLAISNATVFGWGNNAQGQLGLQDAKGKPQRGDSGYEFHTPTEISIGGGAPISDVVTTGDTTVGSSYAIVRGGVGVYATGYNNNGQLGLGDRTNRSTFTLIPGVSADKIYTSGKGFTTYFVKGGMLSAAGDNSVGQLGQGTTGAAARFDNTTFKPVLSAAADGSSVGPLGPIQYVTTNNGVGGIVTTFALTTDNKVFCWGGNNNGQLGLGDKKNRSYATEVATGSKIQVIGSGGNTTAILLTAGNIYVTGYVRHGVDGVGDGNERIKTSFTKVLNPQSTQWSDFEGFALGPGTTNRYVLALDQNSNLWAWGSNLWSQLGIRNQGVGGTAPDLIDVPVKVFPIN